MKKTGKTARSDDWLKRYGKIIFYILLLVAVSFISLVFVMNRPVEFSISARLSNLPKGFERMLIVTSNIELPLDNSSRSNIENFTNSLNNFGAVPTFFVSVKDSSRETLDDLDFLSSLDADFGILVPADFQSWEYSRQESLLLDYRDSLEKIKPRGIRSKSFKADYNTLLVADNLGFDYVSSLVRYGDPIHPDSLLGGKMRLLNFPVVKTSELPSTQEVWTVVVVPSYASVSVLSPLLLNSSVKTMSVGEAYDWIRKKDKIRVDISTDTKSLVSSVQVTGSLQNATLSIFSNLKAISVSYGNESHPFHYSMGELRIPLESRRYFTIEWVE